MDRRDWLLLFIAYQGAPGGLDPVRLQKGMFLFAQETDVPVEEAYTFRPYNYGPMSVDVYDDIDQLVEEHLVQPVPIEGQTWSRYRATAGGIKRANLLVQSAQSLEQTAAMRRLYEIKQDIATKTFAGLLKDLYDEHPKFAVASIFRRPA